MLTFISNPLMPCPQKAKRDVAPCKGAPLSRRSLTLTTYSPGTAIAILCFGSLFAVTKINAGRKGCLFLLRGYKLTHLATYLPKSAQAYLLRDGTSHGGLGPPASNSSQENAPQMCRLAKLKETILLLFLLPRCGRLLRLAVAIPEEEWSLRYHSLSFLLVSRGPSSYGLVENVRSLIPDCMPSLVSTL